MRRLLLAATSVAILLALLAPAALAAGPGVATTTSTGDVAVAVNGTLDVPEGSDLRAAVLVDGTATIAGSADTLLVIDGTATLAGAAIHHLVVIDGRVDLTGGTTVGDVSTLRATVTRDGTAQITGTTTSLEGGFAGLAVLLASLALLFAVGLAVAAVVAGLLVAAFGARQVRDLETRISRQPGQALVAGIIGTVALPMLAVLLIATVVGAPLGLALLLLGLPVLAFVGWLVAAVWVGDWLLVRAGGTREAGHPYRAALLGVVVLALASVLPLVSGLATVFGLGAILMAGWDAVRPDRPASPAVDASAPYQAAPSAG